jgi:hypothetical protein
MNEYERAANRLHHLSMLYAGAAAEVAMGKEIFGLPNGYPGLRKFRDLIDLTLFCRAEINALTALMVKAKLFTTEEYTKEVTGQYNWLTEQKEKLYNVISTDAGLKFTA